MKFKKILLVFLALIYVVAMVVHLWWLLKCGGAAITTTFLMYTTIVIVGLFVLSLFPENAVSTIKKKKVRVVLFSLAISLFVGEVFLRYIVKRGLGQNEAIGGFFYKSPYKRCIKESQLAQYRINDSFIFINSPNTEEVYKSIDFRFTHKYNEMGLRDRPISEFPKDTSIRKIIGLGHSFMMGVGVPQDSTGLRLLENKLNESDDSTAVFTINGARGGSDPAFEFLKLRDYLMQFEPDLIILDINNVDITSHVYRGGLDRFKNKIPFRSNGSYADKGPWWEPLYATSLYIRGLVHYVLKYNRYLISDAEWEKRVAHGKEMLFETLVQVQKLANERDFKFLVVFWPTSSEIKGSPFLLSDVYERLKTSTDIHCINLYQSFKDSYSSGFGNIESLYWPRDQHPNTKGHDQWANMVMDYIVKNKLIQ